MKMFFAAVTSVFFVSVTVHAQTFTDDFDMYGDYSKYLYSTTNAQVWEETPSFPDVYYWAPITNGVTATIEYRYQFSNPIASATIVASLITADGYDPTSTALLDVSPDGTHWTNVGSAYTNSGGNLANPINITSIVGGSDEAFIRADLYESVNYGNIHYSQFLRTANGASNQAPNVYQFQAVVPEPACVGAIGSCFVFMTIRRQRIG